MSKDLTTSFVIRTAGEDDIPQIMKLIQGIADYENLSHEVEATPEKLKATLFGERPYAEVLLVESQTTITGYAIFFHNYSTFLAAPGIFLEDLFVKPEYRGTGMGKALLKKVAQIAVERGCKRYEWNVLDWNEPSIKFYKAAGAKILEDWSTFRLTGDALETFAKAE